MDGTSRQVVTVGPLVMMPPAKPQDSQEITKGQPASAPGKPFQEKLPPKMDGYSEFQITKLETEETNPKKNNMA